MTMTKREAIEYVRSCGEDEGPDSYAEAAEIFAALYGREPDANDGDQTQVWSLCCAAIELTTHRAHPTVGASSDALGLGQARGSWSGDRQEREMRTTSEIKTEIDTLTCKRTAQPVEPIQVSGWYRNTDGTRTEWYWRGSFLREGVTLRADASVETYEALNLEGANAFDNERKSAEAQAHR